MREVRSLSSGWSAVGPKRSHQSVLAITVPGAPGIFAVTDFAVSVVGPVRFSHGLDVERGRVALVVREGFQVDV